MARLPDAIRQSDSMAARYDIPDGSAILVKGVIGQRVPTSQEEYAVSIQRGAAPPDDLFAANDLAEAIDHLQSLNLPGFDPLSAAWQPTTTDVDRWVSEP